MTLSSNATFTFDTIGNVRTKYIVLTNGGTLKSSGTNTLGAGSPIILTGAAKNTITVNAAAQFTITSNVISGREDFPSMETDCN